ncbi:MAG TPA: septum formation initiator family protein [Actinopolymorphaceae bacterium]
MADNRRGRGPRSPGSGPRKGSRPGAGTSRGAGSPGRSRAGTGPARRRSTTPTAAATTSPVGRAGAGPPAAGTGGKHPPPGRTDSDRTHESDGSRRRASLTGRAAVLALVVAALIVSYASSLRAWSEQQSRLADLRAEKAERTRRVAELEREVERWRDPAYVEAQARERFRWVMPGEIGYVVVDPDEPASRTSSGGSSPPDDESREPPAWWQTLWQSVEGAGAATEPAQPLK